MGSPLETGGGEGCIHALKRVKDPGPSAETLGPGWPVFSCGCSADKADVPTDTSLDIDTAHLLCFFPTMFHPNWGWSGEHYL